MRPYKGGNKKTTKNKKNMRTTHTKKQQQRHRTKSISTYGIQCVEDSCKCARNALNWVTCEFTMPLQHKHTIESIITTLSGSRCTVARASKAMRTHRNRHIAIIALHCILHIAKRNIKRMLTIRVHLIGSMQTIAYYNVTCFKLFIRNYRLICERLFRER